MSPVTDYRYLWGRSSRLGTSAGLPVRTLIPRSGARPPARLHHLPVALPIALIWLLTLLAFPNGVGGYAGNSCSRWASTTTPPNSIRVRMNSGRIVRVPFRLYVARVVSSEWNNVAPALREAGAVAVKQYGWYKASHPRRAANGCFDVYSNTRDQIYKVKTPPSYIWDAVNATWTWRLLRQRRVSGLAVRSAASWFVFQTGYRTGLPRRCAADVDGYHLYARSAKRCAARGWSAAQILRVYYRGARLLRT